MALKAPDIDYIKYKNEMVKKYRNNKPNMLH